MAEDLPQLMQWAGKLRKINRKMNTVRDATGKITILQFQLIHEVNEGNFDKCYFEDETGMSKASISTRMSGLITAGLVETCPDKHDRRRHGFKLTDEGRRVHDDVAELVANNVKTAQNELKELLKEATVY